MIPLGLSHHNKVKLTWGLEGLLAADAGFDVEEEEALDSTFEAEEDLVEEGTEETTDWGGFCALTDLPWPTELTTLLPIWGTLVLGLMGRPPVFRIPVPETVDEEEEDIVGIFGLDMMAADPAILGLLPIWLSCRCWTGFKG